MYCHHLRLCICILCICIGSNKVSAVGVSCSVYCHSLRRVSCSTYLSELQYVLSSSAAMYMYSNQLPAAGCRQLCVAVRCSALYCVEVQTRGVPLALLPSSAMCCTVLHCVAVCCNVLQCVAVCCSVLQCVAMCCSVL